MGLWIYKNNTENPNGAYGEWAEFFELAKKSRSGKQRWGGPDVTEQPAAKKLAESMQVGQRVLCWQRWTGSRDTFMRPPPPGVKAAAVGIIEFAGLTRQGRWLFTTREQFSDPVPLTDWSKSEPVIEKIFSFPRRMGTLIELTSVEEKEVLRICSKQLGKRVG